MVSLNSLADYHQSLIGCLVMPGKTEAEHKTLANQQYHQLDTRDRARSLGLNITELTLRRFIIFQKQVKQWALTWIFKHIVY